MLEVRILLPHLWWYGTIDPAVDDVGVAGRGWVRGADNCPLSAAAEALRWGVMGCDIKRDRSSVVNGKRTVRGGKGGTKKARGGKAAKGRA